MIRLIQPLILLCGALLVLKTYYHLRIENPGDGRNKIIRKLFSGVFGVGIILPVLKTPSGPLQKRLIRKANIVIFLFYLCFGIIMLLAFIDFSNNN
jgi:hypothetical protein